MSVEVIYRVKKANGELAGEYMDKKLADAHDQKLDCIYLIADLIREQANDLEETKIEAIAEHLLNNKHALQNALKKIKDVPVEVDETAKEEKPSNVEKFDTEKKVANA